ncbi:MAG: hypothetical protein KME07_04500 [Pegethrix bostrychoides GSE-TBD4-15B]|jgi:hypothetical protein|uniref:Protein argonaute n=1 Tax=Pegethrix bostrychoides GSE-TBD4-15B TaxID=2839662 RepID=A0A951U3K4_9CYAN|nr:hypothetical protein [Pegethrix bostrychoides GSE-TBD4-15B]
MSSPNKIIPSKFSNKSRKLTLNFSSIHFDDAEIDIGLSSYVDQNELHNLRKVHSNTHFFYKDRNHILSIPILVNEVPIGEKLKRIKLSENLHIAAALVKHSFINFLYSLGRKVTSYDPVEFLAEPQRNFLNKSYTSDIQILEWLGICPRYIAAIRKVSFDYQPAFLGLVLDVSTRRWIELPCNLLIEKKISLDGLYVSKMVQPNNPKIAPFLRLIGQVQSIEGEFLRLSDARDDIETILSKDVFLEPRQEAFNRCLDCLFREHADAVKDDLEKKLIDFRDGANRLKHLQKVINYFSTQSFEMVPGVNFSFQPFLTEAEAQNFPSVQMAPRTIYVFDASGEKTSTWHDGGLSEYGPYSAPTFTPSDPRICVICQETQKGRVEQFLYKLINGVTVKELTQKNKRQPFAQGLIRKYSLDNIDYKFFLTHGSTATEYERAVRQALNYQRQERFKWDLALIQIDRAFHDLEGDNNPYLTSKASFLAAQIPTQDFEIETIDVPDRSLCYILNIISLAIYAKLGGVPWLIKADRTITYELIFGLGSSVVTKGRLGQRQQIVGITTVFSGDGNYMLSNLSKAVPIAEYKDALLESLRETIIKVKRAMNWERGNHIRLIFHAFKPLKDNEAEAIKELMKELCSEYDVDYAFLHIVQDHPFILFDESENGVWDYETQTPGKGKFTPKRGLFFRVSKSEVLLSLTGANEVKRPENGIPTPVLLRLHRESTFNDTTYLARQVFTFSCHSWRSFFPSSMPVTITYSELIAKMLGQLGTVSSWNPDSMLGRVGETRWFL